MSKRKTVSRSVVRFTSPVNLDGVVHTTFEDSTDNIVYQEYGLEIDLGTTEVETYIIVPWHKIDHIVEVHTTIESAYRPDKVD